MGRALKIKKTSPGSGNGGASVLVDIGFTNFGNLTNPVLNSANTLNSSEFLGVVGGSPATSTASAAYPEVAARVNILLADNSNTYSIASQYTGRIIRQKGAHKFLVAYTYATVAPSTFIVGQAYQIASLGTTTSWQNIGAATNATAGDIFTATAAGTGNGTAYPVGICVLSNTATPTPGNMSIQYSVGDSVAVYASYLTNKWVRDWNGMTYGNYSNTNVGTNVQSGENFYPTNFFTDEGTVTWSGAEIVGNVNAQNGSLQLAQINNVTS